MKREQIVKEVVTFLLQLLKYWAIFIGIGVAMHSRLAYAYIASNVWLLCVIAAAVAILETCVSFSKKD